MDSGYLCSLRPLKPAKSEMEASIAVRETGRPACCDCSNAPRVAIVREIGVITSIAP
jgi:hypothetical protein